MKQEEPRTVEEALDVIANDSTNRPTLAQVVEAKEEAKRSGHRMLAIAFVVSIIIGIVGIAYGVGSSRGVARLATQQELSESAIQSLNEANDKLIAKGIAPIPLPEPGKEVDANALAQAAAALVLADPRFAGLTLADLRRQVDDYFRAHPLPEGQKPTTEQVTTAVAGIYAANPPKQGEQGRPPTASEIAVGVSSYCAGGACKGDKGDAGDNGTDGKNAKDPTQDQVNAAVKSYCDNPPGICASDEPGPAGTNGKNGADGAPGAPGAPGPKPVGAAFEFAPPDAQADACYYVTTYDNGQRILAQAPSVMCP